MKIVMIESVAAVINVSLRRDSKRSFKGEKYL